jgi:hypothetical protein
MRDMKSDWKRWTRAERIGAVAMVAAFIVCGSSVAGVLAGGSAHKIVFLQATTGIERSMLHGSDDMR